jgi:hypothetical protein
MPAGGGYGGSHPGAMPIFENGLVQVLAGNRTAN